MYRSAKLLIRRIRVVGTLCRTCLVIRLVAVRAPEPLDLPGFRINNSHAPVRIAVGNKYFVQWGKEVGFRDTVESLSGQAIGSRHIRSAEHRDELSVLSEL